MNRLLIVSDSPALASGQARVVRELARRFTHDVPAVQVAGWFHAAIAHRGDTFPYPVVPAIKERPDHLANVLRTYRPDTVLAIGDPWDFQWLARVRSQNDGFRLIGHLNVEGEPLAPGLEVVLDGFDVLTTTSEWGARVIGRKGVVPIHHGVDRSAFYPLPKPDTFMGRRLNETFVILLNAQNTQRKNLSAALQGVALFAAGKTDVFCYANTQAAPSSDLPEGQNLEDLVLQLGIEGVVAFNPKNRGPLNTSSDEAVNQMYGLADALLSTSVAEGFGLFALEAMATLTVPVMTDTSSAPELLAAERGELIPVSARYRGTQGSDIAIVRPEDVATSLEIVYQAWRTGTIRRYHAAGVPFAMARSWDRAYGLLFEEMSRPRQRVSPANGKPIDPHTRLRARRAKSEVAALKLGGLGDMLQTAVVVRALARRYESPVTALSTGYDEVFRAMPEVSDIIHVPNRAQDEIVRSVVDQFKVLADVRYVSRLYGANPTNFGERHAWFYENWGASNARLADLGMHTTDMMLRSLGLTRFADSINPIFEARQAVEIPESPYVCIGTGAGSLGALKLWPHWQELVDGLAIAGITTVQVGGPNDPAVQNVLDRRGATLAQTAYLMERSNGVVALEGGMAHLATAVGKRAVVLFGPTPMTAFAYSQNINLAYNACTPCFWGSAWGDQTCTRGEESCANLPSAAEVTRAAQTLMSLVEAAV